jgi:hypothetical protein
MHMQDDIVLGRKLATGGFGTVFEGKLKMQDGSMLPVIVKKAKEFGQAETWMNERMMRVPGRHCAEFITAFDESFSTPDVEPGTYIHAGGWASGQCGVSSRRGTGGPQ